MVFTIGETHLSHTLLVFLWLFGGNVLSVMLVKVIYSGDNSLVVDEDTTIVTCLLSFVPSTQMCLEPLFSHVCSLVVGTKCMLVSSLLTTSEGGML
jgi:hypothetical protein